MDAFYAVISGEEYGADEMPESLGLYRGRYMIVFHPGELWQTVCENSDEANPCLVPRPGVDYMSREVTNTMLLSGESEMSGDEYERRLWPEDQLHPVTGGRVFVARMAGTGYMRRELG